MTVHFVDYDLVDGFVHHWLVGGPQAVPVDDLEPFAGDVEEGIVRRYHEEDSGIAEPPVEQGPAATGVFRVGEYEGTWTLVRCREDHLVDLSAFYPTHHFVRAWAYVELVTDRSQEVTLYLALEEAAADVWLNGDRVRRVERPAGGGLDRVSFEVALEEGANQVLVRLEQAAVRGRPLAAALCVCRRGSTDKVASGVRVRLPTSIEALDRRSVLERVLEAAYLDQDTFAWDEVVTLRWPDDLDVSSEVMVRLQTPAGRIYAEAHVQGEAGGTATLGRAYQAPCGAYRVFVTPNPKEYYEDRVRVERELPLWLTGRSAYAAAPRGGQEKQERVQEALAWAARRGGVFGEMAKMALGQWERVKAAVFDRAVESICRRGEGSVLDLLGILGMLYRFAAAPGFPLAVEPLDQAILGYRYWHDEPGVDAMDRTGSRVLLFAAAGILAGQRFPDRSFAGGAKPGAWHREKGEELALAWLQERGAAGFAEWDSPAAFEEILVALCHLIDLAENERVWEMAAVIADKLLLTMALNSYGGVFGSTQGRARASQITGGLTAPTAGIARLLWGVGIYNEHHAGLVSLACQESYELPSPITSIATTLSGELWNRERHAVTSPSSPAGVGREVNKVTCRTPDYMLCSAQDYDPGERGAGEHVWQATLGASAVVFVTHPACASLGDARDVGFWVGNRVLPRVAQWKDVLVAIHSLPDDDWMGFTHAYFPLHAFDAHALRKGRGRKGRRWAFAARGGGYLALTASCGFDLEDRGQGAYRELRSHGRRNVWLCQMGRAAQDGTFEQFQDRVLATRLVMDDLSVRYEGLRGEELSFGWEGPLMLNGQEQPLSGFKHHESVYCVAEFPAEQVQIRFGDDLLRLDVSGAPE